MKFRVFLRKSGQLHQLEKFSRTSKGLYVIGRGNPFNDYISYHSDGRYWVRVNGQKFIKKLRQPLDGFKGAETIMSFVGVVFKPMPDDPPDTEGEIKSEDIVFERHSRFGMEVILSDGPVELPPLLERTNSLVFRKPQMTPVLTIEVFDLPGPPLLRERFSPNIRWEEGRNLFFGDDQRI